MTTWILIGYIFSTPAWYCSGSGCPPRPPEPSPSVFTVPGFGTKAECDAAAKDMRKMLNAQAQGFVHTCAAQSGGVRWEIKTESSGGGGGSPNMAYPTGINKDGCAIYGDRIECPEKKK